VNVPVETLARYAGTYEVQNGGKTLVAEISVEGNTLVWNYDGTDKQGLDPVSETTFSPAGTLIEFVGDGQAPATHLLMKTVEGEDRGVRRK
jgi:hypothetical protein